MFIIYILVNEEYLIQFTITLPSESLTDAFGGRTLERSEVTR